MKLFTCLVLFGVLGFGGFAQTGTKNLIKKRFAVTDTIIVDSLSINPRNFLIQDRKNNNIDSSYYSVDFAKALVRFKKPIVSDSVTITYLKYPKFITQTYRQFNTAVIVNRSENSQRYRLNQQPQKKTFTPFEGLNTSGSITRGVTIGNNQNAVLNSELDLQISGKLSEKVTLRASIQDANIPLQENGYSQRLDEFDQVFIDLQSEAWNIRAGDIDLMNTSTYFGNFTKRVQGLKVEAKIHDNITAFASGALVRGQFTTTQFTAQEGNQGPYKLRGEDNQLFVLIVSGTETVYVNGLPLQRGENHDYIIDYNAGEILFNATFPITSEMRITVDYQFSDRNYSRFTVFGGAEYRTETLAVNFSVFSENDAKNQPLQQNLSTEQVSILADAGDDTRLMVAPSATPESFSENRVLYRKEVVDGSDIFVFSTNPNDTLFSVQFTLVGNNQGNYVLRNANTISNSFEYVAPIDGIPQGNYQPITQLIAPERLQVAVLNAAYTPTEKTQMVFELATSHNDLNLFSDINDDNNTGFAGKVKVNHYLKKSDSLWNILATLDTDIIQNNFRTIERLYRAEFNRDWNLESDATNQGNISLGNQVLLNTGIQISHHTHGDASYNFEHLGFADSFKGNKHNIFANIDYNNFNVFTNSSLLKSSGTMNTSTFLRSFNRLTYGKEKLWSGLKFSTENNRVKHISNDTLTPLSQRFLAYEAFAGIGDSTKIYTEVGYIKRFNDSLRSNVVTPVSNSDTYYLKSRFIQNQNTNLQLFVNYRNLKATVPNSIDEQSLNSRLNYNQKLFKNALFLNTSFETNSGTLPQQEFTYVEVEAGQGTFTWNDYNGNNIQELDEFEVAQFTDEGQFIRVLLPNQVFIQTHQNRFSQVLTLQPKQWLDAKQQLKKILAKFYNQTSYLIDRKTRRNGNNFNINPFNSTTENELGLNNSIRNVLFFNRGKQRYTSSYTYLNNTSRSLLSIGSQENTITSHQIQFNHKFKTNWLLNFSTSTETNTSTSENFVNRNFSIESQNINPTLSYIFNENAQFNLFFKYTSQQNNSGNLETLDQQNYGSSFTFNKSEKLAVTGEFNYFSNAYNGNANSPVAYQMLNGLQPGNNFTWNVILQKKLTKFLDFNLNYFGRKSETSNVIHTGNVQLRAFF